MTNKKEISKNEQDSTQTHKKEAKKRNIKTLYLKTELINYYEKFGAKYIKNIGKNEQLFKINVI